MDSIKDFFGEILKNNGRKPEWNQKFFKENWCPYCGHPCAKYWKIKVPEAKETLTYRCLSCFRIWEVVRNTNGEIVEVYGLE